MGECMFKAVIFDLDGVLLDSERLNVRYKSSLAKQLGYNITKKQFQKSLGLGKKEATQYYIDITGGDDTIYPKLSKYRREQTRKYIERYGLPMKTYALEILKYLHEKGIKVALATSSSYELLNFYFSHLDFSPLLDVIVSNDDVKKGKPNPDIFLKALEKLEMNRENVCVVEDSINGLIAAKTCKLHTIFIEDQWKMTKENEIYADYSFKDLLSLKNIL